ncbi:phosphatase PAP2 family protein [Aerococcus mictus]|uniref:phosphatase PAP2 family protein n=1 Tax=Aerococcus mictus TaxID=2976810 RepID=UPI00227C45C4|nr:phosphatase PAP2 family protein [Aerococcus mictus]MCY3033816.1 phosphatase PAP2 family protein [Aerococcus mictus]
MKHLDRTFFPHLLGSLLALIPFALICLTAAIHPAFIQGADQAIGGALFAWGPQWWQTFVTYFTEMGTTVYIIIAALIISAILYYFKYRFLGIWFSSQLILGVLLGNQSIKYIVKRPRPSFIQPLIEQGGYSFPSAHSMGSVLMYGGLCLIAFYFIRSYKKRQILGIATGILCLAIALSRVYLGVHYFSDIVAGLSLGVAWLILSSTLLLAFPRAIKDDPSDQEGEQAEDWEDEPESPDSDKEGKTTPQLHVIHSKSEDPDQQDRFITSLDTAEGQDLADDLEKLEAEPDPSDNNED